MRYNEHHWLFQHGVKPDDIVVFPLWEYGVSMPEDGIYTSEDYWNGHPEICRAFARASLKGWQYARNHRDEALDSVMERVRDAQLPMNRPHMQWMLDCILSSIFPEDSDGWEFGKLSENAYRHACMALKSRGKLSATPSYSSFVKNGGTDDVEPRP